MTGYTLIDNCGELVTCRADGSGPKTGAALADIGLVRSGAMLIKDERIEWLGQSSRLATEMPGVDIDQIIDAGGTVVTPGLVDPHTHPVFAATREDEFYLRNAGKSYMEIAEAGGGIRNSVRKLRQADRELLLANGRRYLKLALSTGTTTMEAKSGYGLATDAEIKSLEVIKELGGSQSIDLVPTFLGAHEFPDEYRENREGYIRVLIDEMLPAVAERGLAEFCDIFTEVGVFDIEQSRRVMTAAQQQGFGLKFHADELQSIAGAELAAEMQAVSAEHLVHISDRGIAMMAEAQTIAVLLPATTFFLGHTEFAPARKMITAGVPVAIATDFNPGSAFTTSMPVTMTVAAIYLKMSPEEIFNAATYNSACGIRRESDVGSLEPGKLADFVIWEAENYRQIPYSFGQNLVRNVYKRGRQVI